MRQEAWGLEVTQGLSLRSPKPLAVPHWRADLDSGGYSGHISKWWHYPFLAQNMPCKTPPKQGIVLWSLPMRTCWKSGDQTHEHVVSLLRLGPRSFEHSSQSACGLKQFTRYPTCSSGSWLQRLRPQWASGGGDFSGSPVSLEFKVVVCPVASVRWWF